MCYPFLELPGKTHRYKNCDKDWGAPKLPPLPITFVHIITKQEKMVAVVPGSIIQYSLGEENLIALIPAFPRQDATGKGTSIHQSYLGQKCSGGKWEKVLFLTYHVLSTDSPYSPFSIQQSFLICHYSAANPQMSQHTCLLL